MVEPGRPFALADSASSAPGLERSAVRGVTGLMGRTLGVQVATLAGTVALARLLSPADFGSFAIALAVQQVARSLVEIGLPAPMVQSHEPPTLAEQRSATGVVVAIGATVCGATLAMAYGILPALGAPSSIARVVAISMVAVPVFAFRLVSMVLIERSLRFGRLVVVEVAETVTFYAFAIPAAALGLGVYSLAGAVPAAAAVSVVVAYVAAPWRAGISFKLEPVRAMIPFGLQIGSLYPLQLARDVGILGIATIIGGPALAGFASFAQRLFGLHLALFAAIQRVGLPVLVQVREPQARGRQAGRAGAVAAVPAAFLTATVVGVSPALVHVLFGAKWEPTADVVAGAGAGYLASASAGPVLASLAIANRDGRTPLIAAAASVPVGVLLAAVLAHPLGATGIGIASGLGLLASVAILFVRSPGAGPVLSPLLRALVVAGVSATITRVLVHGEDLGALVLASLVATGAWCVMSCLIMRGELRLVFRLVRRNAL